MATPKYIFTSSNGQLKVVLDNTSMLWENDEILSYRASSINLYDSKKIQLFDFGEFERDFLFENIESIDGVVPSDITEAYDLLSDMLGVGSQDLQSVLDNGNTASTPLGSVKLLDGTNSSIQSTDGTTYDNKLEVETSQIRIASYGLSGFQAEVVTDTEGNVRISTSGGIATYNGNELATVSAISGTFVAFTSITVVNGIITAIS